ncbi:MAG: hypothetical protein AAF215_33350 [Cyanobacteria bacterium P01_A01_bin.123]
MLQSVPAPSLQTMSEQFKAIAQEEDTTALIAALHQARQHLSDANITMAYWFAYQDLNHQKRYDAADWLLILVKNLRQLTCLDDQHMPEAA